MVLARIQQWSLQTLENKKGEFHRNESIFKTFLVNEVGDLGGKDQIPLKHGLISLFLGVIYSLISK